ncbi:MAG: TolC family protein [Janthinobacterium lividum]
MTTTAARLQSPICHFTGTPASIGFLLFLCTAPCANAAVETQLENFNFTHTGMVSSGLVSLLATYSNTVDTAAPVLNFRKFDAASGTLNSVSVTVTTSQASFLITPTGLLSLLSGQSATRKLAYNVTSGATTAGNASELVTSGATLLTLLNLGSANIGAAPLAATTNFSSPNDVANFTGTDSATVNLVASNTLTVLTLLSLFNGAGMAIEAAAATLQASEANLADVQVSLAANVADAYFNLRDRQRRSDLLNQSLVLQQRMLTLVRERLARGTASEVDVLRLENQLEQGRGDLLPLQAQMETCHDQLATLAGMAPGQMDQQLRPTATALALPPASIDVGNPGELLGRRPDIRAAERQLAADTAKIGQAQAARYPSIKFLGLLGIGGTRVSDLSHLDDYSLIAAPMLSWNFLDFGRGKRRVEQADAVRDEAQANYRKVMLAALRDAEDALSRFRHTRAQVAILARNQMLAERTLQLTRQRFDAGTVSLIDVLDITRQSLGAEQALSQGQASLLLAYVAVQKSLGLGWEAAGPAQGLVSKD